MVCAPVPNKMNVGIADDSRKNRLGRPADSTVLVYHLFNTSTICLPSIAPFTHCERTTPTIAVLRT